MFDRPASVTTERLLLHPFEPGDVEPHAAIRGKPEVVRHLSDGEALAARARERAERGVEAMAAPWSDPDGPGYGPWAAVGRASGRLIGPIGLHLLPD